MVLCSAGRVSTCPQGRKEANVELTPFIIGLDEPLRAANCQLGFISFIVKPLWTNLLNLIPTHKETLLKYLDQNISFWKNEVDKYTVETKVPGNDEGSKGENKDSSNNDDDDAENLEKKTDDSATDNVSSPQKENKQGDSSQDNPVTTETPN